MTGDSGSMESILSGAGVTLAAALVLVAVVALYRSTGPANAAIVLQTVAADVCGDIGTSAISTVPYIQSYTCDQQGVTIRVTSDYVVASSSPDREFARPLAVRVYPGNYKSPGGVCWNGTAGMREYLNMTFGRPGTRESPLSIDNGSHVSALLERAGMEMASQPVGVDQSTPLIIEKLFIHFRNASSGLTESTSYVFIYQG
jgi:hypothetical protein